MFSPILDSAQIIFSIVTVACIIFDGLLLFLTVKLRISNKNGPLIYILFFTVFGITGKLAELLMVDSWLFSDSLEDYQGFRKFAGEKVTLLFTFSYLVPLFLNWLMTIHRISILLVPVKSTRWFGEKRLFGFSLGITITVFIWLLIPFLSDCPLNFNILSSRVESACGAVRHPITLFQNKYLIYVPLSSMLVNSFLVLFLKLSRKTGQKINKKRDSTMIRQALFVGIYLSVYEILYLHLRVFPNHFESLPFEYQSISYLLRLFAIGSLNFFVYFVETNSTRKLILRFFGYGPKIGGVLPTLGSQSGRF